MINGVKFFAMGADYIPEDCVYNRITRERMEYLVRSSVKAHYNCLRVWGGGYYPSDKFYDLCDEYGIIVWQDLMYACNIYDLTDEFMAMGKGTTGSDVGTGGMATKLHAAKIATESGADMVIANADDLEVMWRILKGEEIGTLFKANKSSEFALLDYIQSIHA